jgi:hypothetical protein
MYSIAVEHLNNVRVRQLGGELSLVDQQLAKGLILRQKRQNLFDHQALVGPEPNIAVRQKNLGHAALANLVDQDVAAEPSGQQAIAGRGGHMRRGHAPLMAAVRHGVKG